MEPQIRLAAETRRRGESVSSLQRALRSGELVRVRHGAYAPAGEWALLRPRDRHLELLRALEAERPGHVFSHWSAAALHDLPVVGRWPERPHVVTGTANGVSRRALSVPHAVALAEADVVEVAGCAATSVVRTAIDVAAAAGGVTAMIILDAAAARADRDDLEISIARRRPFRGVARVDRAMRDVTGKAESALESLSLLRIIELGFPRPLQQQWFHVAGEDFRVDFSWPEHDVIGEADGWEKYGDDVDSIKKEKRREDALRARVRGFARWEWADAWHGERLAGRLEAAGLPRTRVIASRPR